VRLVVLDAERVRVRVREGCALTRLLQLAVEWNRAVIPRRAGGRTDLRRRNSEQSGEQREYPEPRHARPRTLGRVCARLRLALFATTCALFAVVMVVAISHIGSQPGAATNARLMVRPSSVRTGMF